MPGSGAVVQLNDQSNVPLALTSPPLPEPGTGALLGEKNVADQWEPGRKLLPEPRSVPPVMPHGDAAMSKTSGPGGAVVGGVVVTGGAVVAGVVGAGAVVVALGVVVVVGTVVVVAVGTGGAVVVVPGAGGVVVVAGAVVSVGVTVTGVGAAVPTGESEGR